MKETELKPGEICERWKDIEGFEGRYQVSTFGNVRRVTLVNGSPQYKNIKPWINSKRRAYVTLTAQRKRKRLRLDRLVAEMMRGESE